LVHCPLTVLANETPATLSARLEEARSDYAALLALGLSPDLTRDKPSPAPTRPLRRPVGPARRPVDRRRRHGLPQLRRAPGPARTPGDLRRVPPGTDRTAPGRRQLEPGADARLSAPCASASASAWSRSRW